MSWLDRHNEKVFKRKVREYVGEELSNFRRGYFCHVSDDGGEWWGNEFIDSLSVIFNYRDVSIKIRLGKLKEYNDYENETVESAGQAIVDAVLEKTIVWNANDADCMVRDYYGLDWLSKYVLNREWKEGEK